MICDKRLILILCFALAPSPDRMALAQPVKLSSEPWFRQCSSWTSPSWDKAGARRSFFPVTLSGEIQGTYRRAGKSVPGVFVPSGDGVVALISELGSAEPTSQFVTPAGKTIDFYADGSDRPELVRNGRLADSHRTASATDPIECLKGASATLAPTGGDTSMGGLTRRATPSESAPKLTDVFAGRDTVTGGRAGPRPPDESKLEDVFRDKSKSPAAAETPASPPTAGAAAAPAPRLSDVFGAPAVSPNSGSLPGKSKTAAASAAPSPPDAGPAPRSPERAAPKDGASSPLVCDARNRRPLPVANGVALTSLQAVGIRNDRGQARSFEYFGKGGDARPLDRSLDVAESARQLISYELVADWRRTGAEPILVSLAGVDPGRLQLSRPAKSLRVIVVAGPAELAISGLDLVGNELGKPGGDPVKLDIEWYLVEEAGTIRQAGRYSSFELLVKDAIAKNRERADVLNEAQVLTLLDAFENLLKSQTQPFEKAIWVKGAYPIPSSIPHRFEKLIDTVSSNPAAPHTPAGQPGKWLVLMTSRMPGFSIAYLKEPIYASQIGDVIEESGERAAGPRRIIDDPVVLATRLRLAGAPLKTRGDPPPDAVAPTGKLALDAKDIFAERGYLLSPETADALQLHLQRVSSLWDSAGLRPDVLAELEDVTGKSQPTLQDILQTPDPKKYPQLPNYLPNWFLKPIRDLSPAEARLARNAVAGYAAGAGKLAAIAKASEAPRRPGCPLFYVAEAYFGFDRFDTPPAGASRPKPRTIH